MGAKTKKKTRILFFSHCRQAMILQKKNFRYYMLHVSCSSNTSKRHFGLTHKSTPLPESTIEDNFSTSETRLNAEEL